MAPSVWAGSQQVPGANERVRLVVCGARKRGVDHVRLFSQIPNVTVGAFYDVDESVLRGAWQLVSGASPRPC